LLLHCEITEPSLSECKSEL